MDSLLFRAARFAQNAHAGQRRKFTDRPYIEHPARVASRAMLLDGTTPDLVAAAWLHDVIEDCGVSADDLRDKGFPELTVGWVVELTNPSKNSPLSRAQRKQLDRDHIGAISAEAKALKALDRADNLSELQGADREFQSLYVAESILLARCLADLPDSVLEGIYTAIDRLGYPRDHSDPRTLVD